MPGIMARSIFLLVVTLCVACGGTRDTAGVGGEQQKATYGDPSSSDSVFFSLERTPCFGRCATYAITVYRTGAATYVGMQHVERIGTFSARLSQEAMTNLLAEAEDVGFWQRPASYDSEVTDLPSTYVRVVSGPRDHRVKARYNVPSDFKGFVERCDRLLLGLDWQPVETGR
jgi:hypothetical protein